MGHQPPESSVAAMILPPGTPGESKSYVLSQPGRWRKKNKQHHAAIPHHPHLQWKAPASGLDVQGSPKHQKQLQPGMDTSNMYINLNKCMIPTHMPSWQPAVPFACCYRHSEINATAWDSLLAIFITKHIHLAGGGQELSLWVNKILGQLAGNDREQISVGSLPWLWKPIMAGGQRSVA